MNAIDWLRKALIIVAIIMLSVQSSCAPAPQVLPTQTNIIETATLSATSTPEVTSTPAATPTPTATPLPTATFTPAYTPTQLPEFSPAAESAGNVLGLVLWNNQPVPEAAVWLCPDLTTFNGCTGYKTNTDRNGYYVFKNVAPGEYVVAMNSFSSSWFIFYFGSDGSKKQSVSPGKDLILDPWNIWKLDLQVTYPRDGKAISEATPTFKWEAYPDATYYQITIYYYDLKEKSVVQVVQDERVDVTEFTPAKPLVTCKYHWHLEAFNSQGVIIAQNAPPNGYTTIMEVNIYGVPGKC